MTKFEKGDRVKLMKRPNDGGPDVGSTGVVIDVVKRVKVAWDMWTDGHGDMDDEWWVDTNILSMPTNKDTDVVTVYIVVSRHSTGALVPAAIPYQHSTRAAAEKEAMRLAKLHRGQDFMVFQNVSAVVQPKVPKPFLVKVD